MASEFSKIGRRDQAMGVRVEIKPGRSLEKLVDIKRGIDA